MEERLRRRVADLPGEGEVSVRIFSNLTSLADSLRIFTRVNAFDLLVMGTHQRGAWGRFVEGSASREAIRAVTMPLLCVPLHPQEPAHTDSIPSLRVVLCPTDLSEGANRAIAYAYALVRGESGVVVLCNVRETVAPQTGIAPIDAVSRAELEATLRKLIPSDAETSGISTHVVIAEGRTVADAIIDMAKRVDADAICMASHGRSAVGRALLGSVAEKVVHWAHRPVFIIRRE
jgi:nucleotide-binding universal stress UspA family protein